MIEIFAEKLGPILVTDSVAKFDLLTSVPLGNGRLELRPACRITIPIAEIENIVGRLHEHLRGHLKSDVAADVPADAATDRGPVARAQETAQEIAQETAQAATQSVVVLTVPKIRT